MTPGRALVADIGGTRARLALVEADGRFGAGRTLEVAAYPGPLEAIGSWLAEIGDPPLQAAALAIAAPVDAAAPSVRLTNGRWLFVREDMRSRLGLSRLVLLNDFAALARSLPVLPAAELRQVGGGPGDPLATRAVIGPGTGLGVSGLVRAGAGWRPLVGEGGHVTLAAADAREAQIIALARKEYPHVSAERLVSGTGLPLLRRLVAEVDGLAAVPLATAEIVAAAVAGEDPASVAAVDTFCAMLGGIAGDLALTLGALGGVYLGGGIVPRLGPLFDASPFRRRFDEKGRLSPFLAAIPAYVILSPAPALLGALQALAEEEAAPPA